MQKSWDEEKFGNTEHACCEQKIHSHYNVSRLRALSTSGKRVTILRADNSTIDSIDRQLYGTGGSCLHAAISACGTVSLYGAGLLSIEDGRFKVYSHYYDEMVGTCSSPPSLSDERAAGAEATAAVALRRQEWLRDRISNEVVLHVLHVFGIVRWVQRDRESPRPL